ncbi:hypothetical protein [Natrialba sp. SSL1]|uniref:hypothetical protein n=1 Tax=Natrialba sp. SSL1 TaxID=1869245 RepID=UPI0008F86D21|nr:hypothetical protein [Natrialba sp. SSL1]OIB59380.1 hypothetical protein BBD46_01505 [Natrialba sp. SSL1]
MTTTSATAAAEQTLLADGGSTDLPPVDVGDHVQDREDADSATMVVVGTPLESAAEFEVKNGQTVADFNPDYPADDAVVKVVYPSRSDVSTRPLQRYSFPRSRVEIVSRVHDRDNDQEAATDGGVAVATATCYGCQHEVPEANLEQVMSGGMLVDEEIVEYRSRHPQTGECRDDIHRAEYEHTIPMCPDCRAKNGADHE